MNHFRYCVVNNETNIREDFSNEKKALNLFEKLNDMNISATFYRLDNGQVVFERNTIVNKGVE